ncbi:MAG: COX15/CtaA family protein [Alphaproteobacteria bacterium]|nr:COX15/CtaA family protein [Alphaproteobacteria bacterium]
MSVAKNRNMIRLWLGVVMLALFALVIVGGATRLTDSGLSITEWKPIHGIIPPLSEAAWQEELELYRQIPEYQQINKGMSLSEFKYIYWWEWAHRFLARGVGVLFAVPLAFFWLSGRLETSLKLPLLGILALGGLQGFIGWWMVTSGLVDRVDVSQYRLATHLTLAAVIVAAIMWVYRGLGIHSNDKPPANSSSRTAGMLAFMVLVQIYLGGLVAGLDAGLAYNSWPLMDAALVPTGLLVMDPAWINIFENAKTVQFDHRMFGYALWIVAALHMLVSLSKAPATTHARRSVVLFALVTLQAAVGIGTLLLQVPVSWALAHQGLALIVLAFAVAHWRAFRGSYAVSNRRVAEPEFSANRT